MEEALMEAMGINGKAILYENVLRIKRVGVANFFSGASKTEKDILISQIGSIQFKKAGFLNNGYIELILMHGHEKHESDRDHEIYEDIISFRVGQQEAFEELREALEAKMARGSVSARPSRSASDLDELDKLASLLDRGVITQDEFNRKKKQILGL